MTKSLPVETWDHILGYLTPADLLTTRLVCKQWNILSSNHLNTRKLQISICNSEGIENFCQVMMKGSTSNLHFVKFNFTLPSIHLETLDHFLEDFGSNVLQYTLKVIRIEPDGEVNDTMDVKLNLLLKSSPNLEVLLIQGHDIGFELETDPPLLLLHLRSLFVQMESVRLAQDVTKMHSSLNTLLTAAPNLEILSITGYERILEFDLNFPPLLSLRELSLIPHCKVPAGAGLPTAILNNWIQKAPSLTKLKNYFTCNQSMSVSDPTLDLISYLQKLQHIPQLYLAQRLEILDYTVLETVCRMSLRFIGLQIMIMGYNRRQQGEERASDVDEEDLVNENHPGRDRFRRAFTQFLASQSENLKELVLLTFHIKDIDVPLLAKLESLNISVMQEQPFLPFLPERFPVLKNVIFRNHNPTCHPFTPGFFTVENLTLPIQSRNWKEIFPNADILQLTCITFDSLKLLLPNPPDVHHLDMSVHWDEEITTRDTWNTITGNARVDAGSLFSIAGINDTGPPREPQEPSLLDLSNLRRLKIMKCKIEAVTAIAFLSHSTSFHRLQELEIGIQKEFRAMVPEKILQILKEKHDKVLISVDLNVRDRYAHH